MTLILPKFRFVPSLLTTQPRNVMLFATKQHLLRLSFRLTSLSLPKIACKCVRCSSQFLLCMLRPSTNIFKNLSPRSLNTSYIVLVKVLVVSFSPKGVNVQSYNLFLVIRVIFLTSSGTMHIYQNLDCKPNDVNHEDLPNCAITSWTKNMGK